MTYPEPEALGEQIGRQDQVAPGDEQQLAETALRGRQPLPVLRAEALLDGGEEQGVLQLLAALEKQELPVVGESPDNLAVGEEKIVAAGVTLEQLIQGLPQDRPERGVTPPGFGVGEIIPQKLEGPGRVAGRLQHRGVRAGVGLDGRGLAVVSKDPGLAPESEDKGVRVALVHLAAGFVADVRQDDGTV